jgi:hypothetical protein
VDPSSNIELFSRGRLGKGWSTFLEHIILMHGIPRKGHLTLIPSLSSREAQGRVYQPFHHHKIIIEEGPKEGSIDPSSSIVFLLRG